LESHILNRAMNDETPDIQPRRHRAKQALSRTPNPGTAKKKRKISASRHGALLERGSVTNSPIPRC